jgi:hypothetical protein
MKQIIFALLLFQTCCCSGFGNDLPFSQDELEAIKNLQQSFNNAIEKDIEETPYSLWVDAVTKDGEKVTLNDGSVWEIGWWYRTESKKWKKGDKLYIEWDPKNPGDFLLINENGKQCWSKPKKDPLSFITILSVKSDETTNLPYLQLSNSYAFYGPVKECFPSHSWKPMDRIFILPNRNQRYQIWNIDLALIQSDCTLREKEITTSPKDEIDAILKLEESINKRVLQQPQAASAVTASMLNYAAGLKEKEKPIGVFLFLGPTGVGKTELAKVLADEIFKTQSSLIRFDMSHFTEPHSISRLIGSPPGYVNHDEGGQLTEAVKEKKQGIVLLDEMEKAHSQVHKAFLPVFDEGFILDNANEKIDCSNMIFIMTSNLCGTEIAENYRLDLTPDEILSIIEPKLIKALSPELYNRVEPVLFRPLEKETMKSLVELMLKRLTQRLEKEKGIELIFDSTLTEYLQEKGYHPLLGARPLKKVIEKEVITTLSVAIIKGQMSSGDTVLIRYQSPEGVIAEKNCTI